MTVIVRSSKMEPYIGTGLVDTYSITIPFLVPEHIQATLIDLEDAAFPLVQGADFVVDKGAKTLKLLTGPLKLNHRLVISRVLPITQETSIRNQGAFYPELHEDQFDRLIMIDQQQQAEIEDLQVDVDRAQETADKALAGGGGSGLIGDPTDGQFGNEGGVSGLDPEDLIADGFDKVEVILEKLAPAKPPNLSDVPLVLSGAYTAKEEGTGIIRATVTSNRKPVLTATNFYDGSKGILSAFIGGEPSGRIELTGPDNTGRSDDSLKIIFDLDPHAGVFGKEGFWRQLTASITPENDLDLSSHEIEMQHSLTGASRYTAYIDNPGVPTISNLSAETSGGSRFASGVPGLAPGAQISVSFDVSGAVSKFYHVDQVGRAYSPQTSFVSFSPASPPSEGESLSFSGSLTVSAGAYTENWAGTAVGFAANGASATGTFAPSVQIRLDTVSNESSRRTAGVGQFPASGYDGVFDSTQSLLLNEELQLLNGQYQFPPPVDYSGKYPAGPDYSGVSGGTFSGYRWALFDLGSISNASFINLNLLGTSGISQVLEAGMQLQIKVEGETGWLDSNAAYPGVGNPAGNGDPAVVVGSSTTLSRRVTFGAVVRSGKVLARVGFPEGSTKKISGVTRN